MLRLRVTVGGGRQSLVPRLIGLAALAGLLCPQRSQAQVVWLGGTSTEWNDATNWSGGIPTSLTAVTIDTDLGNQPIISTADALSADIIIGDDSSSSANTSLAIEDGQTLTTSGNGTLGNQTGSSGSVVVDDSIWSLSGNLTVGDAGNGTLNIANGGNVTSVGSLYLGLSGTGNGTVWVTDTGSTLNVANVIYVGVNGLGNLTVANGGTATANGYDQVTGAGVMVDGPAGTVLVTDPGSSLNVNDGALLVGYTGTGTLTVANGGNVSLTNDDYDNNSLDLGFSTGSGTLIVTGDNSTLLADYAAEVGLFGVGNLTIANGGSVKIEGQGGAGASLTVGNETDSSGNVTVDGTGLSGNASTLLLDAGALVVGGSGTGNLTVSNGGNVSITGNDRNGVSLYVGENGGSNGTVLVTDANSTLNVADAIYVGDSGNGNLTIANGGNVTSGSGDLGYNAGATGIVTVDGVNSTWSISGNLDVGRANLSITNGGNVSIGGLTDISYASGSAGSITVDGANSTLTTTGLFSIGTSANGTLTISNGGTVVSTGDRSGVGSFVGNTSGVQANVTVTGIGSTWTNSQDLWLGPIGSANLSITNGGMVSDTEGIVENTNVTVDGANSTWLNSAGLSVGYYGPGNLAITNGGNVSSSGTFNIGGDGGAAAIGNVSVNGANSTLNVTGATSLGSGANATLTISNGANFTSAGVPIALNASWLANVTISNATWSSSQSIDTGVNGVGSLTLSNGAQVTSANGTLGTNASGNGTVVVTGNSGWTVSGSLYIGESGTGNLAILSGNVTDANGYLGLGSNANSAVTVDGSSSFWINNQSVVVALSTNDQGAVTVSNGGTVTSTAGVSIAPGSNSLGLVTVTGANSTWTDTSTLNGFTIGAVGNGTLTISNGGVVNSNGGSTGSTLGYSTGSLGTVIVTDANSTWNLGNSSLMVGFYGNGNLSILNGGNVTDLSLYGQAVALESASQSSITVDGNNSLLSVGFLMVGDRGNGTLNISNNGTVSSSASQTLFVAYFGGSTGLINQTGGTLLANGGIEFGSGNATYDLSGGTLELADGWTSTGGTYAFNFGNATLQATNNITSSLNITLDDLTTSIIDTNGFNLTWSGVLSGAGSLTKAGVGVLVLDGLNTFTGALALNAGTLDINSATALGTGVFTINGGNLDNTSGAALILTTHNIQDWDADFTFTGAESLNVGTGAVTLGGNRAVTVTGNTLTVGGVIGDAGDGYGLTKDGNGTLVVTAAPTYTGNTTVNAGTLSFSGNLNKGNTTVAGLTAVLTVGGTLNVGEPSASTLTINNGGNVSAANLEVGPASGGSGTAIITGPATLNVTNTLYVGYGQLGNLTASNGALIESGNATVGVNAGATGSLATISNATWVNTGLLEVASATNATLAIANGSNVTTSTVLVSNSASSNGTLSIDDSNLTVSSIVSLGSDGNGALAIANGALVSDSSVQIGVGGGGNSSATLDDSTWISTSSMTVGDEVNGSLTVTNGGNLTTDFANVGLASGSNGSVLITGPNSIWTDTSGNGGGVNIGSHGNGALTIANGGMVSNYGIYAATFSGSSGSISVTGAGSTLVSSNFVIVGDAGNATLSILNGGNVTSLVNGLGIANQQASGNATVTVDGTDSLLNVSAVAVGSIGNGTLIVSNNATVLTAGTGNSVLIGAFGGTGNLTQLGGTVDVSGNLLFGTGSSLYNLDGGTLEITSGITSSGGSYAFNLAGGALQALGNYTSSVNATLASATTFDPNGYTATWSGVLSGTGNLTKINAGILDLDGNNSYTGVTTITGGTLAVATLADGGQASGIGASSSAEANLIINGGTLQYLGTSDTSTDRMFTVGVNGATLDSSGAGNLDWTNTTAGILYATLSAPANFTITFAGNNTGNNTFAPGIQNASSSNLTNVVKTGSGQWILTNYQFYTGSTTITGGTLDLDQSFADFSSSLITVTGNGSTFTTNFGLTFGNGVNPPDSLYVANGGTADISGLTLDNGSIVSVDGANSMLNTGIGGIYVGDGGSGASLSITNGGQVSDSLVSIGTASTSMSTGLVSDPGSSWVSNGAVLVGSGSDGALTIANGASFINTGGDAIEVGYNPGINGTVTVTDPDSTFSATGGPSIYFGYYGNGALNVVNGGNFTTDANFFYLGYLAGSNGNVTVDGTGSTLTDNGYDFEIGYSGAANLTVSNGGSLTFNGVANDYTYFDVSEGGSANFTINGGNVSITSYSFNVGYGGPANLTISNGGTLTYNYSPSLGYGFDTIGGYDGSSANVLVTGPNSTLTLNAQTAFSGFWGNGTANVTVSNGGTLNTGIPGSPDDVGSYLPTTVLITDPNSTWNDNSFELSILGEDSNVTIANGAHLNVPQNGGLHVGYEFGDSYLTINGTGSQVVVGSLTLGYSGGNGTITISNGGNLTVTGDSNLSGLGGGQSNVGNATVLLTGAGSIWNAESQLTIGGGNYASVTIGTGATLAVQGSYFLIGDGSEGDLIINGGLVQMASGTAIDLGDDGGFGNIVIDSGTLQIDGSSGIITNYNDNVGGSTYNLTLAGGTLQIANGNLSSSKFTVSPTLASGTVSTIDTNGFSATISPNITGAGGLIKISAGVLTLSGNNTFGGGLTLDAGNLNINSATAIGTGTFTINGGNVGDSGSNLTLSTNNAQDWDANFSFVGAKSLNLGTGAVTLAGNESINVTTTAANLTVGGPIGDGGDDYGLTKLGPGTLILSGANTYTGNTTITAGTLELNTGAALASGNIIDNGILAFGSSGAISPTGNISGTGSIQQSGTGTLVLSSPVTVTGGVIVSAGTLDLGSSTALGSVTLTLSGGNLDNTSGAPFTLTNALTWSGNFGFVGTNDLTFSSAVALAKNLTITVYGGNLTDTGVISGSFGLTIAGAGSFISTAKNTYTGNTTVSGGTLLLENNGNLTAANFTIDNTTGGNASLIFSNTTWDPTASNRQDLVGKSGNGTLVIEDGANVTTPVTGTLGVILGNLTGSNGTVLVTDTGTQWNSGAETLVLGYAGNGSLTIANGANVTSAGVNFGESSTSNGTALLTGANTLWTVTGQMNLGLAGAGNLTIAAGATLDVTDQIGISQDSASSPGTLTIDGGTFETGAGALFTLGEGSLSSANLILNSGTLQLDATQGMATSGGANLTLGAGTIQMVNTGNTATIAAGINPTLLASTNTTIDTNSLGLGILGNISGGGGLIKISAGNLSLSGNNSFTGGIQLNAGTLDIDAGGNGTASALGAGPLTISGGNLDNLSGATVTISTVNPEAWNSDFTFDGANSLNLGTGAVTLAANRTITTTANTLTVGGVISDGGNGYTLTKLGAGTLVLTGNNTFSGNITISAGTLGVAVLNDGGIDSGLGSSSSAASNLILNGGFLQYAGATDASTDRLFTFGTNGGGLDASGIGNVTFSNTTGFAFLGNGARTLTLTGTGIGDNSFAAVIPDEDPANITSLTKSGTGEWVLSTLETYTGVTTITGGTLSVTNLGNGGVSSGIGAASSAAANLVLNGGILQYSGTGDDSTDRLFTLGASGGGLDSSGTGNLTFSNTTSFSFSGNGARTFTLTGNNTGDNVYDAVISDEDPGNLTSLTKSGAGQWVLNTAETYTGNTTVSGGTLEVNNTLASANYTISGGALAVSANNLLPATANITVSGGTLAMGGFNNTLANLTLANGNIAGSTSILTVNSAGTFALQNGTVNAILDGTGALNKTTTGTVALDDADTYSGGTNISAGTLLLGNAGALGVASNALTISGGTLDLGSYTGISVGALTLSGGTLANGTITGTSYAFQSGAENANAVLAGAVALTKTTSGTVILAGANTYSGGTNLNAGTINFSALDNLGTGGINFDGGTLQYATGDTADISSLAVTLASGGGTIDTNGNDVTFANAIGNNGAGGLTKIGVGVLTLDGVNTYTGATTINAGTLLLNGASTLGTGAGALTISGGVLDLGGQTDVTTGAFTLSGGTVADGTISATSYAFQSGVEAVNAVLAGAGALTKTTTGLVTLTGVNTYSGGTNLDAGTINFSALDNLGTGSLTFAGGTLQYATGDTADISSLTVTLASGGGTIDTNGNNVAFANTIGNSGAGGLTKTGLGNLTLSALNTYTGATTVNLGTLLLNLSSAPSGVLASTSTLTLGGGALDVLGNSAGVSTQTLGNPTLTANTGSSIIVNSNGGTATTLTLGNTWTPSTGVLNINLSATGANVTSSPTLTNSILGYATVTNATTTGFATVTSGNLALYTGATTLAMTSNSSTTNYLTTANVTMNAANHTWNSIELNAASGSDTLNLDGSTRTLTLTSNAVLMVGAGNFTISNGTLGASGSDLIIHQMGSGTLTVSANVSGGAGELVKDGAGVLDLTSANNAYTGGTFVDAGTLLLGAAKAAGTGAITVNNAELSLAASGTYNFGALTLGNGTLQFGSGVTTDLSTHTLTFGVGGATIDTGANNVSFADAIGNSGAGGLTKIGAGNLTLSGADTYTGNTVIGNGFLVLNNAAALQNSMLDYNNSGGDLSFGTLTSAIFAGLTGAQDLALTNTSSAAVALTLDSSLSLVYSGNLSGAGSLTDNGTGNLTLGGNDTYAGTTTINNGTLVFTGNTSNLGAGIVDNAALVFNQASDSSFVGAITGTGALAKAGTGNLTLTGNNSYSGGTSVSNGTLIVDGATDGTINSPNANLTVGVGLGDNGGLVVQNGGEVTESDGYFGYGAGSTAVVGVTGTGSTMNISGNLAVGFNGAAALTIFQAGQVNLYGGGSLGGYGGSGSATVSDSGSQWNIQGSLTVGSLGAGNLTVENDGVVSVGGSLLLASGASASGNLNLNSGGILEVGGTDGIQTGAGSYAVNLGGGTLQVSGSDLTTSAAMNLDASTTSTIDTNGFNAVSSGGMGGGGALVKTGGGALTLSGNNTYTGNTTVNNGALVVNGQLTASTITVSGSTAVLGGNGTVNNVAITNGATLSPGFANTISGNGTVSGYASLTVSGNLSWDADGAPATVWHLSTGDIGITGVATNISDTLSVLGALTNASSPGTPIIFDFQDTGYFDGVNPAVGNVYTLITTTSNLASDGFTLSQFQAINIGADDMYKGLTYFMFGDGGDSLQFVVVPEPAVGGLAAGLMALALALRRRKRR